MKPHIVLGWDGGPETSGAIERLAREHDARVVTLTLDLGDAAPLDGIRGRSLESGAIRAHVLDVREEFARDIIVPAARAGTFRAGGTLAALARPLLAKKLVDVARIEKAQAVAYIALAAADPIEGWIHEIDPAIKVIRVNGTADGAPAARAPRRSLVAAGDGADVEIAFADGVPASINGIVMRLPELLESLTTIAVEHGVGLDGHAFVPAATVLHAAYAALGTSRRGTVRLKLLDGTCRVEEPADVGFPRQM